MIPVTVKEVIDLNKRLIENFSPQEMQGVKEFNSLDSAINRPFQTMFGMYLYPDVFEKAVALFESLAKNHPFHNGNKRTAFCAMTYFLYINDYVCYMNNEDGADLAVDFVVGTLVFKNVVQIIKEKTYRKSSWKIWLDKDGNYVSAYDNRFPMMVRDASNDNTNTDAMMTDKIREDLKEVFANAKPLDEEAFEFILNMYYDTFKELVHR